MFQASRAPSIMPSAFDLQETGRLEALHCLDIMNMPRDETFDRIARLVQATLDVPIAFVSLLDGHRQLMKACEGLTVHDIARRDTFCTHAIEQAGPTVIPDALKDPRFAENPHVTGKPYVRFYAGMPLRTAEGHNVGTLCAIDTRPRAFSSRDLQILADLGQLAMDQFELRQLANLDALTGILSRRAFKTSLARAVAQAVRYRYELTLITFDIDHFKSINDGFGHPAGDTVLLGITQACLSNVRSSDDFGRIGGEEFAILLPHTGRQAAFEIAEKLRRAIEALSFDLGVETRRVTASFGLASLDANSPHADALMANADAALYEAKAAGRNQCVAWRSPQEAIVHPRRRVLKSGMIHFNNHASTVDCTIRSLNEAGAGIDLSSSYGLPEKFNLSIRSDGIDTRCRVVSKTDNHVEVEFC